MKASVRESGDALPGHEKTCTSNVVCHTGHHKKRTSLQEVLSKEVEEQNISYIYLYYSAFSPIFPILRVYSFIYFLRMAFRFLQSFYTI